MPLYPTLIQLLPERRDVLSTQLRRALGSDLEDEARLAVSALYEWTRDFMQMPESFTEPSKELFREIGIAIAARRAVILRVALDIARWLFDDGPREMATMLVEDCEYGLSALLEEASYARREAPFDVPGIRAACVRLAVAMQRTGFGSGSGASAWISAAEDDPLPEVKHALSQRQFGMSIDGAAGGRARPVERRATTKFLAKLVNDSLQGRNLARIPAS